MILVDFFVIGSSLNFFSPNEKEEHDTMNSNTVASEYFSCNSLAPFSFRESA